MTHKKGCEFLYGFISVSPGFVMTCPDHFFGEREQLSVFHKGEIPLHEALQQNYDLRMQAIDGLKNNKKTPCDNCTFLKNGNFPDKPSINHISLPGRFKGQFCNFSCIYCNVKSTKESNIRVIDVLTQISELYPDAKLKIDFCSGEFFIKPDATEVLEFCYKKGYVVNFLTNGSVYNDAIAPIAKAGNVDHINISLDSGTAKTYAHIKRVDCYNETLENIKKYSNLKIPLVLKYIMLKGINDNKADVEGFLKIAIKYKTSVAISCNQFDVEKRLNNKTMKMVMHLIKGCNDAGLNIIFYHDFFHPDDVIVIREAIGGRFRSKLKEFIKKIPLTVYIYNKIKK